MTTEIPGAVHFLTVPAGTRPSVCRGPTCGATMFWVSIRNRAVPVHCDVEGGVRPSSRVIDPLQGGLFASSEGPEASHDGRGVNHFEDCPDAEHFRRGIGA